MTSSDNTSNGKIDGGKESAWWIGCCWTAGDRYVHRRLAGERDISFTADGWRISITFRKKKEGNKYKIQNCGTTFWFMSTFILLDYETPVVEFFLVCWTLSALGKHSRVPVTAVTTDGAGWDRSCWEFVSIESIHSLGPWWVPWGYNWISPLRLGCIDPKLGDRWHLKNKLVARTRVGDIFL